MAALTDRPKLRKVDRTVLRRGDEVLVVLHDPLGIAEPAALPQEATQVLDMLDGQRTTAQVRQSLFLRGLLSVTLEEVTGLVAELSAAGFLDDDRFRTMWESAHREFMREPDRAPRFAGVLYPDEPSALHAVLHAALPDPAARLVPGTDVIGVLTPHQPLTGAVASLADATLRGLPAPEAIDLIVLLGTDHHPGRVPFALTDKHYGTPIGGVRTDGRLVAAIERRLPWIRREEIRHREAMSLELAALTLRHLYGDRCPPALPVLCGQTALVARDGGDTDAFLATMEHVLEDRRVLWWIAAELGHAGPAYGRPPLDAEGVRALRERDLACIDSLRAGRPEQLASRCLEDDERLGRPSGAAALSTVARLLPVGYRAELVEYLTSRPPGPDEGWAGLAGMRFARPVAEAGD
jgi:AmmeMemoRadiSam system protein B